MAGVDLDQVESGASERIAELRERRQRLSLDAISAAKARAELERVESERAAAEAELGRVELARTEQERRDEVAQEAEQQRPALTGLSQRARQDLNLRPFAPEDTSRRGSERLDLL